MLRTLLLILTTLSIASCGTDKKENTATAINVADTAQQDPMSKSLYRGKDIYAELCISCHLPSGKGVPGSFPPLNPSIYNISRYWNFKLPTRKLPFQSL